MLAVVIIFTFVFRVATIVGNSMKDTLFAVLIVLIIFGYIGYMIKNLLDYFDKQKKKRAEEEGEVIEKEPDSESENESKEEEESNAAADSKAEE